MPRPARPWFRFHSEAIESRKVQRLKPVLFKHWMNLLCLANRSTPRGELPLIPDIAYALRPMTEASVEDVIEQLVSLGFIDTDGGGYVMHDWDDWQRASDANLTIGRETRAHDTRNSRGRNDVGTGNERASPAVGTSKERGSASQIREEKIREEQEKEGEKIARTRKRSLTETDIDDMAGDPEFVTLTVSREATKFHDYVKAKNPKYVDEVAAFRNWLRRAIDDKRIQGTRGVVSSGLSPGQLAAARVASF